MGISLLAKSIAESPTLKLNEEARLLREKGEAVIHLGIGEPKNKAPIAAVLSSAAKLNVGDVKYCPTDGTPSLKKAIIHYTEEAYDRVVGAQNVIVSSGAKQSLFNLLYCLLNPQDEVVVLAPYWVSYPEMIRMVYGVPVVVTPEDGSFVPRFEEIERAITPNTRAILVNSPNNPSGTVFPDELIEKIVTLAERRHIYVIMDDIYHKLVFDGVRPAPGWRFTNQDIESTRVIVVNGISKLYGMTGFRIGWTIANRELVQTMNNVQAQTTSCASPACMTGFRIGWTIANRELVQTMNNVQAQTTSCASPVMQAGAEGALTGLQSQVESLRLTIQNNRDVMMQELSSFSGVKCVKPHGTFYCLPDFRAYEKDSIKLCEFLLKKARVVTVPGKEFGMEGHLRLSYAGTVKDVTEGVARMKWALDAKAPSEIYIGDRKMVRDWL